MFQRFSRGWQLAKESFAVLRGDKRLLLFPVMSAIAAIVVSVSFLVPLALSGALGEATNGQATPLTYLILFLFYYANYFVIVFFNSALVGAANICLSGGHATLSDGLGMARSRLGRIAAWALVAATVGLLLRMIENRAEKLGRIVAMLLGTAWTLITYFIIPVIVFEDEGMFESVKRSTRLLKQTWGEELGAGIGFGLLWFLLAIPGLALTLVVAMVQPLLGFALGVIYFLLLAATAAAVKSIFTVALYRYASQGQVPSGFTPELVQNAFGVRRIAGGATVG